MPLWSRKNTTKNAEDNRLKALPSHLSDGAWAESQAAKYLRVQGLHCIERNFSCKYGEIDLIMEDGKQLVFVEVRYRQHHRYGSGVDTVDSRKQLKLRRAAEFYLQTHQLTDKVICRFDVIGVTKITTTSELAAEIVAEQTQQQLKQQTEQPAKQQAKKKVKQQTAQLDWIKNAF